MIRFLILFLVIGAVVLVVWWDRTDRSRKRQVFFSLYNKALAKATQKDSNKLHGLSISILEVMDETDINPTPLHRLLKQLEDNGYLKISSNTVKLTVEGVAYFRFKYLSEKVNS